MTLTESKQVPCVFLGTYLGQPIQATSECAATRDARDYWYIDDFWWTESSGTLDYNRAAFFGIDRDHLRESHSDSLICISSITPLDPTIRPLILEEEPEGSPIPENPTMESM